MCYLYVYICLCMYWISNIVIMMYMYLTMLYPINDLNLNKWQVSIILYKLERTDLFSFCLFFFCFFFLSKTAIEIWSSQQYDEIWIEISWHLCDLQSVEIHNHQAYPLQQTMKIICSRTKYTDLFIFLHWKSSLFIIHKTPFSYHWLYGIFIGVWNIVFPLAHLSVQYMYLMVW